MLTAEAMLSDIFVVRNFSNCVKFYFESREVRESVIRASSLKFCYFTANILGLLPFRPLYTEYIASNCIEKFVDISHLSLFIMLVEVVIPLPRLDIVLPPSFSSQVIFR